MNRRNRLSLLGMTTLVLGIACSEEGSDTPPNAPPPPPDVTVIDPDPAGVLLPGDPATDAADNLPLMRPSASPPADIVDDLLVTRLTAVLMPGATIGEVNEAIDGIGARVVAVRPEAPALSLVVPRVASRAGAKMLADSLTAHAAIAFAFPAFAATAPAPIEPAIPERAAAASAAGPPDHLRATRTPATWNAAAQMGTGYNVVPVLVPDVYYVTDPHDDIAAQAFAEGAGNAYTAQHDGSYPGNHGFHVSGILAADPEANDAYVGVHPDPFTNLTVTSFPISGLSWGEKLMEIADHLPASGHFVLSTSLGYNDPGFGRYTKAARALHAATWREYTNAHTARFLHATAAGNDGDENGDGRLSRYGSPFCVSAQYADLSALYAEDDSVTASQQTAFGLLLDYNPDMAVQPPNVLVVGASTQSGAEAAFSSLGSDLRTVGVDVPGPCVKAESAGYPSDCDGTVARYQGTSMATPQVAGLAAYMWNLSPTASVADIRGEILDAWAFTGAPGLLDAYQAVLALDPNLADARVRLAILDVAGATGNLGSNDRFDEHDLTLFLDAFQACEDGTGTDPCQQLRFDLNGDGSLSDGLGARFDLDANGFATDANVVQFRCDAQYILDENLLTDRDILIYYAFSPLYDGDTSERDELICGPTGTVQITGVPDRLAPGQVFEVTVTVAPTSGSLEGIDIELDVDGGTANPNGGDTNAGGVFTTTITMDDPLTYNHIEVVAGAHFPGSYDEATAFALRVNDLELVEHEIEVHTSTNFSIVEGSGAGTQIYQQIHHFKEDRFAFTDLDTLQHAQRSGDHGGMHAETNLTHEHEQTIEHAGGFDFSEASLSATLTGSTRLDNPNFDLRAYHASGYASGEMDLAFIVWGEPASYTLSGTIDTDYYAVEIDGDDTIYECDAEDAPCGGTIQDSGTLQPGYYHLRISFIQDGTYEWSENGCDFCVESGFRSLDGSASVTFEISQ